MVLLSNVSTWVYPKFQNQIVFTYRHHLLQFPYQEIYRGYSLKGIPKQARPTGNSMGAHSYTVKRGDARIEVSNGQKRFDMPFQFDSW